MDKIPILKTHTVNNLNLAIRNIYVKYHNCQD